MTACGTSATLPSAAVTSDYGTTRTLHSIPRSVCSRGEADVSPIDCDVPDLTQSCPQLTGPPPSGDFSFELQKRT